MSKKVLDALVAGSSDDSSDEGESSASESEQKKQPAKVLKVEDLQRAGYKSGPSVLLMKAPAEEGQQSWAWSNGRDKKESSEQETWEERQQTRHAATEGADEVGRHALKAVAQAERLREERSKEHKQLHQEGRLTWNQKEKRKREEGKTSRGGSYVEEEKRLQRNFGVYSGFD